MKKLALTAVILLPGLAYAHTGSAATSSFMLGVLHPLQGLDHMLVLLAAGLWLSNMNTPRLAASTICFAAITFLAMASGRLFPYLHLEESIIATLVVLPTFLVLSRNWQSFIGYSLMAAAALLHGIAHGAELSATWSAPLGVVLTSAVLLITVALGTRLLAAKLWPMVHAVKPRKRS